MDATRNPSWGQVLATTIRLWSSRRMPRISIEWPDMSASPAAADQPVLVPVLRTTSNPSWGRVLVTTVRLWLSRHMPRISIEWRVSFGRLLAAAMLSLGLLAVGVGTAGVAVASSSAGPALHLPARPSPVPAPSVGTVAPVWLTTGQRTAPPVLLTIPAIGVRTKLIDLGLNSNGTLQVPASTAVAGWYSGSPSPGAVGAAVIAGHVDSRAGLGVFFWLRTLRPGDRVYIGRSDGTTVVFTVTKVQMYVKDQFPTASVYGPAPDAELRLITCGGTFDRSLGSYLSNVVVFARRTG
ncbi:MAG: class F sortase [Streptosporangiaceae bacterium]